MPKSHPTPKSTKAVWVLWDWYSDCTTNSAGSNDSGGEMASAALSVGELSVKRQCTIVLRVCTQQYIVLKEGSELTQPAYAIFHSPIG